MAYQYLFKPTRLTNYSVIPNDLFALDLSSIATVFYSKLLNRANLFIANGRVDEKTYMAACIANALIDLEKRVLMTDFATISNISIFDSAEYVSSLSSYDLLIIDDYGQNEIHSLHCRMYLM